MQSCPSQPVTNTSDCSSCSDCKQKRVQVKNGSMSLHGLMDGGILTPSTQVEWEQLQVVGMDTALAGVGTTDVLPDIQGPPQPEGGFSFCLFNNAWGTNYVQWTPYGPHGRGATIKSRFILSVRDKRRGLPPSHMLGSDAHLADLPRQHIDSLFGHAGH